MTVAQKKSSNKTGRSPLSDPGFKSQLATLIEQGALKEGGGAISLLTKINNWCASSGFRPISKAELANRLERAIWTSERVAVLTQHLRLEIGFSRIYQALGFLPKAIIDKKAKSLRGSGSQTKSQIPALSEPGIGRLMTTKAVAQEMARLKGQLRDNLPLTSPTDPFEISIPPGRNIKIVVINGPHLGLTYNPVFHENITRNSLAYASSVGADCVVIPSGLFWLDLKKSSGFLTTHRGMISGLRFEAEVMDPRYGEEAVRIRLECPADQVAFMTLRERFLTLLKGLRKIVTNTNGSPVYRGSVYLVLGREEEEFIEAAAHAEILYIVTVERNKVRNKRKALEAELRHEISKKSGGSSLTIKDLRLEIDRLTYIEKIMIQTNVDSQDRWRFVDAVRAYFVQMIQETIPHSKVVAQGTSFIKVGSQLIEIHQDRGQKPNRTFINDFLKKSAGRLELEGTLSDVAILASAYSVGFRFAEKERSSAKSRLSPTQVFQPPVALDGRIIRNKLVRLVLEGSAIERLLHEKEFEPGILVLDFSQGLWSSAIVPIDSLTKVATKPAKNRSLSVGQKRIYILVISDEHIGHPWKWYGWDAANERFLGLEQAMFEIFRRGFFGSGKSLPIHGVFFTGDKTQARNFDTASQLHQSIDPYQVIENRLKSFLETARQSGSNSKKIIDEMRAMRDYLLQQVLYRGIHWPQAQAEDVINSVLRPNLDFFGAVLQRSVASGVKWEGIGQILSGRSDSRDIGAIVDMSGNHYAHTVDNMLTEFFYARILVEMLSGSSYAKGLSYEDLQNLIKAPLHGNTGIGLGHVSVGDLYHWGISLRHDPSEKSGKNGDPLLRAPGNVLDRGNFSGIFDGIRTLHISGDVHRTGVVHSPQISVISCPSGTLDDPYGHRGFSKNNTGCVLLSFPAGGPSFGPIRTTVFHHHFIENWLRNPFEINWNQIFENPV